MPDPPGRAATRSDRVPSPSAKLSVHAADSLMSAHQKAVEDAGSNGFVAVAATKAALLTAQGWAGPSVRRATAGSSRYWTSGWRRARLEGAVSLARRSR
ncbi:hypothetical protein GCM10010350_82650 [Streptomyces galilaeus]|nr:hypothetical protein GCM10010350_82650 [Streptomyces galilaeus]